MSLLPRCRASICAGNMDIIRIRAPRSGPALIFCSGMVAINPEAGEREHGTVTSEARRIDGHTVRRVTPSSGGHVAAALTTPSPPNGNVAFPLSEANRPWCGGRQGCRQRSARRLRSWGPSDTFQSVIGAAGERDQADPGVHTPASHFSRKCVKAPRNAPARDARRKNQGKALPPNWAMIAGGRRASSPQESAVAWARRPRGGLTEAERVEAMTFAISSGVRVRFSAFGSDGCEEHP